MRKINKFLGVVTVACMLMAIAPTVNAADSDGFDVIMDPSVTADLYINETSWSPSCAIGET